MINTNKNILIVASVTIIAIIGGVIFFLNKDPLYQKESLTIEQDLVPIELSQEEELALKDEGLVIPSGEDVLAKDLQIVRSSDEIDAIEADLNETNLLGLDAELESIEDDLFGL